MMLVNIVLDRSTDELVKAGSVYIFPHSWSREAFARFEQACVLSRIPNVSVVETLRVMVTCLVTAVADLSIGCTGCGTRWWWACSCIGCVFF
jgi:hypothetical protein